MPVSQDAAFNRVTVDHALRGVTQVTWRLHPDFAGQIGMLFQLQFGETGVPEADDWQDIGAPGIDVIALTDATQHDFGSDVVTNYRIKMTLRGVDYFSQLENCGGRLNRHNWLEARGIIRRELLRHRLRAGTYGWLFKQRRRTAFIQDNSVIDFATNEVIKSANSGAVGTDRAGGYFAPHYMFMDTDPQDNYPKRDAERGPVSDNITRGRTLAYPELTHGDVWVTASGDDRFAIHGVKCVAQIRNVPLVVSASLRQLDLGDPIYEIPLPPVPPLQTLGREEL
jgi:hypothetical protein